MIGCSSKLFEMAKGDKVLLNPGFIANCVPVYERERMENIRRNNEVCRSLGLKRITPSSVSLVQHKRSTTKAKRSNSELDTPPEFVFALLVLYVNFCRIFLNGVEVYSLSLSLSSFSELFDRKLVDGLRLTMDLLFLEVELESTVAEL